MRYKMRIVKLILHSLVMIFSCTQLCYSASLQLTWNANTETDLAGYKVYYGTSPGSYGNPHVLGDVTEYELSGLEDGTRYYIALTAFDTSNNESEKSVEESGVTPVTSSTSTTPTTTTVPATGTALHNGIEDIGTINPLEEDLYYIDVPSGQGYLLVELIGNPDADLYVRYGSPPTLAQWDCRPYTPDSSNEMCSFSNPDSGIWYIMVRGYSGTVDYTISATYNTGPPPITTTTTTPPPPPPTTTTTTPSTTTTASGTSTTPSTTTTTDSGTTTTPSTSTTIPVTTTISSIDSTPPTGTVIINNGVAATHSLNVILTLSAFDSGRELNKREFMSFSNDAITWSDPEPYTTAKLWTLTPGEGTKTVYAQFRDAAGNWMIAPAQDHIIYEASENACEEPEKLRPIATTASSQFLPLFSKDNAVDGKLSTTWSTLFSFFKKDEFITLDLGEIKRINWFTMQAASTLFGTDFFPINFTIEISSDNMTWEEISTEQGYAPPIQSTHSDSWDCKSLECRYIRVYITKAKTIFFFFKMAQIAEIEVYGCNITDDNPLLAKENASMVTEEDSKREESNQQESDVQKDLHQILPTIPGKPIITIFK
jgi:hypothetical protein